MEKLKIVVVSDDIDLKIKIKNILGEQEFAVVGFFKYDGMTNLKITGYSPDVVIMAYDSTSENIFEIAEQVYLDVKGVSVVLLAEEVDVELLSRAMQHGINQVLPISSADSMLRDAILNANSLERKRCFGGEPVIVGRRCRVITFFSGKGGTGKTTMAVNTAAGLAMSEKKTLIIDANLQFGDVTVLLDLDPHDTIYELSQESEDMSIDVLKSMLTMHSSGLDVLAAPKSPELAEYITNKTIELIINTARPYYEYIIIDLAPGFSDTTIAAIENSDTVNFVADLDIRSLRNAKICLGILEALHQDEKVELLLNRVQKGIISKSDFEKILARTPKLCLPEDTKTVSSCMNRGIPFIIETPKAAVSKAIKTYVAEL